MKQSTIRSTVALIGLAASATFVASARAQDQAPPISVIAPPSMQAWSAKLSKKLSTSMRYPDAYEPGVGDAGFVRIRFYMDEDGSLTRLRIVRASGSKRIDKAAIYAVSKLDRISATPKGVGNARPIEAHLFFAKTERQMQLFVEANRAFKPPVEVEVAASERPLILASVSRASFYK